MKTPADSWRERKNKTREREGKSSRFSRKESRRKRRGEMNDSRAGKVETREKLKKTNRRERLIDSFTMSLSLGKL